MTCLLCKEEADGLDGEHCQMHWEQVADEGFWQYVASPEYAELELIAEMERSDHGSDQMRAMPGDDNQGPD